MAETDQLSSPLINLKEHMIKPNVYANLYPEDSSKFPEFQKSLEQLQIQDSSLTLEPVNSGLLGTGMRCGFLGLLHKNIVCSRLKKEYNCNVLTTTPSITYRIIGKQEKVFETSDPQKIPNRDQIKAIEELFVQLSIITPDFCLGSVMELCQGKRGLFQKQEKNSSF